MSKPKRPRDTNQLAKLVVDIATGNSNSKLNNDDKTKNVAAVALGRKGGKARAKKLADKQRSEIASLAAQARWKKNY